MTFIKFPSGDSSYFVRLDEILGFGPAMEGGTGIETAHLGRVVTSASVDEVAAMIRQAGRL